MGDRFMRKPNKIPTSLTPGFKDIHLNCALDYVNKNLRADDDVINDVTSKAIFC